jgi:hypothetical protein
VIANHREVATIGTALFVVLLVGCVMPAPSATLALGSASPIAASPVSSPTVDASARQLTVVAADDRGGRAMSLTIVDPDGLIATARAATPEEITPLGERISTTSSTIAAGVAPGDPPGILVVWVGTACDRSGTVTLSGRSGQIVVAPDPRVGCDLVPTYRGLVLTFTLPVDLGAVRPVLLPTELLGT